MAAYPCFERGLLAKLALRSVNTVTLCQSLSDLYDVDRGLRQVHASTLVSSALEFPFDLLQDGRFVHTSFVPSRRISLGHMILATEGQGLLLNTHLFASI
jgi:hypothetical protein